MTLDGFSAIKIFNTANDTTLGSVKATDFTSRFISLGNKEDDDLDPECDVQWVQCEKPSCHKWYHQLCVDVHWPDISVSCNRICKKWYCCT